jgi:hypothetical protein
LQEIGRLAALGVRQAGRIGAELGDRRLDPLQHGAPVLHGGADVGQHGFECMHDCGAARFVDRIDQRHDDAFAQAVACRSDPEMRQLTGAVALDGQHGMDGKLHLEPLLGEFRQHRVEQERHVVVDQRDGRDGAALAGGGMDARRSTMHLRRSRRAVGQEIPGLDRNAGQQFARQWREVLGCAALPQFDDEIRWDVGARCADKRDRRPDQPVPDALVLHRCLSVHASSSRLSRVWRRNHLQIAKHNLRRAA